jgi:hypothetical protein
MPGSHQRNQSRGKPLNLHLKKPEQRDQRRNVKRHSPAGDPNATQPLSSKLSCGFWTAQAGTPQGNGIERRPAGGCEFAIGQFFDQRNFQALPPFLT